MRPSINFRKLFVIIVTGMLTLFTISACAQSSPPTSAASTHQVAEPQANAPETIQPVSTVASGESVGAPLANVIVYASDVSLDDLYELDFYDDPASPGGKFISLPNNGDELDPPPENDPHFTFDVQVQSGVPYRCWVHLKVGTPKGRSQANTVWVQFTGAVDATGQKIFEPGSENYLTVEGPGPEGWKWVECDYADSEADSLVYFESAGQTTVRIQAGSEGVGIDQFLLSAEEFLDAPPSEAIVEK